MSQHDYNIANQTAINFRSDLNNALVANTTNNSGDTEPSAIFENMFWYDSANNLLKIRDETNTTWITIGNINQVDKVFRPYINNKWVGDFLDEDTLDSNSATSVPSQQSVKAYVDTTVEELSFPSLGKDQTWQNVTSDREVGDIYINTTGVPIQVSVSGSEDFRLEVRDQTTPINWVGVGRNQDSYGTLTAVIPPTHVYRVPAPSFSGSISNWAELR